MNKCVGLFAGIGGIELGMQFGGFQADLLCELLPEAQAILRRNFTDAEIKSDVIQLKSIPSDTTVLCAGFPCQDLSSSGQKRGIAGLRSSLVGEVFRLAKDAKPEWILLENVRFMLHLGGGEAMSQITAALEELGYRWAYRVMNSQNFGVPQRRERVYILASRNSNPAAVLFREPIEDSRPISKPTDTSCPIGFYWTEGTYATGLALDAVPPLKGGSTIGIPSSPAILLPSGQVGMPDIRDAERLQGFPDSWTQPAEEVVKSSFRWKLVGNAVTVDVCKWIAEGLAAQTDTAPPKALPLTSSKWPEAAFGEKGKVWTVVGHYGPVRRIGLSSFLSHPLKPLSKRAVSGFINRAMKGSLKYPTGFIDALSAYNGTL
jgi:DNA (cytosine-5)-methyltransferase 1